METRHRAGCSGQQHRCRRRGGWRCCRRLSTSHGQPCGLQLPTCCGSEARCLYRRPSGRVWCVAGIRSASLCSNDEKCATERSSTQLPPVAVALQDVRSTCDDAGRRAVGCCLPARGRGPEGGRGSGALITLSEHAFVCSNESAAPAAIGSAWSTSCTLLHVCLVVHAANH